MQFSLLALAGLAAAKMCVNNTVSVDLASRNVVYGNLTVPASQYAVTAFTQVLARIGSNATALAATGFTNINGTYQISTQFCRPDNMTGTNAVVQVLTHGIGFDKTYWDLSFDNFNYSYVNQATDKYGYCTLSYDRLGVGNSSKGDPRDEIQANLEVEALYALTGLLRNGSFPGVNHTFSTVVHAGHSFGSALTYQMVNKYPNASDAIILTGFSSNSSFMPAFLLAGNYANANVNQPLRFGNITLSEIKDYLFKDIANPLFNYIAGLQSLPQSENLPNGYLVSSNPAAIQGQFLLPGYFDWKQVLPLVEETKQTATVGEFLSLGAMAQNNSYTGPVLVLTGAQDQPFCGGNCYATGNSNITSIPADVQQAFAGVPADKYKTYIQPYTGHAINYHFNATTAYDVMNNFFQTTGGAPATKSVGTIMARSLTSRRITGRGRGR